MPKPPDQSRPTITRIAAHLHTLGVREGGVLMVHSSLKSMGRVASGAETVIRGLLEALDPRGTLLMPALGTEGPPEQPVFDQAGTATWTGLIPETFRRRPGTLRSIHPSHSVCAAGPRAAELLADHLADSTPCGPHSPFAKIPRIGGQILMLGCGLGPNTSFHAIEELAPPPYLFGRTCPCLLRLTDGREIVKDYRFHGFDGWTQRYDRIEALLGPEALRPGPVLEATAWLIEAEAMWRTAKAQYARESLFFVDRADRKA